MISIIQLSQYPIITVPSSSFHLGRDTQKALQYTLIT